MILGRFFRDESGMALGLAVVMIVLIGVMGAGLLVFVRSDLEAVVGVNGGQKAFEIAEAGVQVAKQQQLSDVVRQHYDKDYTNDCVPGRRLDEDWSATTTGYANSNCTGGTVTKTPGVTRDFAGGKFNVTIECYDQLNDPATDPCAGITEVAPESIEASKRAYFKITSTGYYPTDGSGAKRKIETIYYTNSLDVPTAYYTPKNIEFNGGVSVKGVSFFAGGSITKTPSASLNVDRVTPALYRNWDTTNPANFTPTSNLNTRARPFNGAGFAAAGTVDDFGGGARGVYDYDSSTTTRFVRKESPYAPPYEPNATGTISYPFNPDARFDLELLKQIAVEQGNYHEGDINIDGNNTASNREYPKGSTNLTVFYVKANGAEIDYNVAYEDPYPTREGKPRGLIVIEGGNLKMSNSSKGFNGAVIVTGNGTSTGNYTSTGNDTVEGFVIADGTMRIGGDVGPSAALGDFTQRPGFYDMKLWSWRELYE
jgi:hypothetical protein